MNVKEALLGDSPLTHYKEKASSDVITIDMRPEGTHVLYDFKFMQIPIAFINTQGKMVSFTNICELSDPIETYFTAINATSTRDALIKDVMLRFLNDVYKEIEKDLREIEVDFENELGESNRLSVVTCKEYLRLLNVIGESKTYEVLNTKMGLLHGNLVVINKPFVETKLKIDNTDNNLFTTLTQAVNKHISSRVYELLNDDMLLINNILKYNMYGLELLIEGEFHKRLNSVEYVYNTKVKQIVQLYLNRKGYQV